MHRIPVFGLGTYYKSGSPNAPLGARRIREFFYLGKNNREGFLAESRRYSRAVEINGHPRGLAYLDTPESAYDYAAEYYCTFKDKVLSDLGITDPVALVPIPSSKTVSAEDPGRWPSLELANALARGGFGVVRPVLVRRQATLSKEQGGHHYAPTLAKNLKVLSPPIPANYQIVLVDDCLTWGHEMAAAHHVLQKRPVAGIVMVCTDGDPNLDPAAPRIREVRYSILADTRVV